MDGVRYFFRMIVPLALILLGSPHPQATDRPEALPDPGPTIRSGVQRVVVPVTVSSRTGLPVPDLTEANFTLEVGGRPQPEFSVLYDTEMPAAVVIAFDRSARAVRDGWPWVRAFIHTLIHRLGPDDRLSLAAYGGNYDELEGFTTDRPTLLAALDALDPGTFAQHPGLWASIKEDLRTGGRQRRRPPAINRNAIALDHAMARLAASGQPKKGLILITDGEENLSRVTLHHVQFHGIPIYAAYLPGSGFGHQTLLRRGAMPRRLAAETGGALFEVVHAVDPVAVAATVAGIVRNQYLISFPPNPRLARHATHPVTVTVDRGDVRLRHRRSFRFHRE